MATPEDLTALIPPAQAPLQHFTLANGLKVYLQEDHRAPLACAQLWYHIGSSHDLPGHTNLAHVLEHMLFEGSDKLAPGQYSRVISRLGGYSNASTFEEATAYEVLVPASRVEVVLEIMADTMVNARLDQAAFAKATEAVDNERRQRVDNNPLWKALEHHQHLAHGASAYAIPIYGDPLDLEYMKLDTVRTWYRTWYIPNNATLLVVGDIQLSQLQTWVERHFAHLQAVAITPPSPPKPHLSLHERKEDVSLPGLVDGLIMSFNVPSLVTAPDRKTVQALELALALLINGPSASLYAALVRDEQLITSISGAYRPQLHGDTLFSLYAYSNPSTATPHAAAKRVWEAVEAFKQQPPSLQALERAKRTLLLKHLEQRNDLFLRAQALGYHATLGLPGERPDDGLHALLSLSADDVHEAANKFLTKDRLTTTHLLAPAPPRDTETPVEPAKALTCTDLIAALPPVDLSSLASTRGLDRLDLDAPTRDIQAWHTSHGSRVCFVASEGSRHFQLQLRFQAGACREEQVAGVAALTLYMLDQGADGLDAKAIAERLAELGATLQREVSVEHTTLTLSGVGNAAAREQAITLFTALVARPDFTAPALVGIKRRLLAYVRRRDSAPASQALPLLHQQLFGEHPYARPTIAGVKAIESVDPTMLRTFHSHCYAAANLDITLIADMTQQEATTCCEHLAAALPEQPKPLPPLATPAALTQAQVTHIEQASSNSRAWLAVPLNIATLEADGMVLEVARAILGGSFESRLMRELRDRRSLTYGIEATLMHYRKGSWLQFTWDVEPAYRDAAAELVKLTLQCFIDQGPSQGELELAVNQLGGKLLRDFASDSALAARLAHFNAHGLPAEHYRNYLTELAQLTPASAQAALARLMNLTHSVFISVGPQTEQQPLPAIGATDQ